MAYIFLKSSPYNELYFAFAHKIGENNLLSSAFERVRYLEGIRKEVCRMKLKAEQPKQKHGRIAISKSGHLIDYKLMPQVRCGLFYWRHEKAKLLI